MIKIELKFQIFFNLNIFRSCSDKTDIIPDDVNIRKPLLYYIIRTLRSTIRLIVTEHVNVVYYCTYSVSHLLTD